MKIRVGYELNYDLPQPTPMIVTLNVHHSRVSDLVQPDYMRTTPAVMTGRIPGRVWKLVHAPGGPRRGISA